MPRKLPLLCLFLVSMGSLHARTRISLGYGAQFNALLNQRLDENLNRTFFNSGAAPLQGYSGNQLYDSNWGFSGISTSAYALVQLPEVRIASDLKGASAPESPWGVFASLGGMVPQTTAYALGSAQLRETNTCSGVDYSKCPLAALGFVSSAGTALYDIEVRSQTRFFNLNAGVSYAKKLGMVAGGEISYITELGLTMQSFSVSSQFLASRCTNGTAIPCNQTLQLRIVQGELKSTSLYALGPVMGFNLRYERPASLWFVELAGTVVFLFTRLENSGYVNFLAGGTAALSQANAAAGVDAAQNNFAVLPAAVLRFGVRL
jgi:hypothetical protein